MSAERARRNVTTEGAASTYRRTPDSGNAITYRFCRTRGATAGYRLDPVLDIVAIPIGAFTDPRLPPPRFSVYESHRRGWVAMPANAAHHD